MDGLVFFGYLVAGFLLILIVGQYFSNNPTKQSGESPGVGMWFLSFVYVGASYIVTELFVRQAIEILISGPDAAWAISQAVFFTLATLPPYAIMRRIRRDPQRVEGPASSSLPDSEGRRQRR